MPYNAYTEQLAKALGWEKTEKKVLDPISKKTFNTVTEWIKPSTGETRPDNFLDALQDNYDRVARIYASVGLPVPSSGDIATMKAYVEPLTLGIKDEKEITSNIQLGAIKEREKNIPTVTSDTGTNTPAEGNSTVSTIIQALKEAGAIGGKTPSDTRAEMTAEWGPKLKEAYKPYEERSIDLIKRATEPTLQKSVESTQKELGARGFSGGVVSKTLREKVYDPYQEKLGVAAENIALESWKAQRTELENIINGQTQYDATTRSILTSAVSTATAMDFQKQMQESQNIYDWTKFNLSMDYDIWKTKYTTDVQTKLTNAAIDSESKNTINSLLGGIFAGIGTFIGKKI